MYIIITWGVYNDALIPHMQTNKEYILLKNIQILKINIYLSAIFYKQERTIIVTYCTLALNT